MIDFSKGLEYRNKIAEIDEKYSDVTKRFNEKFKSLTVCLPDSMKRRMI